MAEYTPLPWFKNGRSEIGPRFETDDQSDGMLDAIASAFGENKEADAAFIVHAVNNHHALVKALTDALCELTACATQLAARGLPGYEGDSVSRAQAAARLVLKTADGKQGEQT